MNVDVLVRRVREVRCSYQTGHLRMQVLSESRNLIATDADARNYRAENSHEPRRRDSRISLCFLTRNCPPAIRTTRLTMVGASLWHRARPARAHLRGQFHPVPRPLPFTPTDFPLPSFRGPCRAPSGLGNVDVVTQWWAERPRVSVRKKGWLLAQASPLYSHRNSPKKFTQHQLFAGLVLKSFLKTDLVCSNRRATRSYRTRTPRTWSERFRGTASECLAQASPGWKSTRRTTSTRGKFDREKPCAFRCYRHIRSTTAF